MDSTLALGATGGLAKKLGHGGVRGHAKGQAVSVATVAVDEVITGLVEDGGGADGDGLLTAVEMAEPPDFLTGSGVFLVGPFLEAANEHHHSEPVAFETAIGFCHRGTPVHLIGYGHFDGSIECLGGHGATSS